MSLIGINLEPKAIGFRIENLESYLELFRKLDFDHVEIPSHGFPLIRNCSLDIDLATKIAESIQDYSFSFSIHAPDELNLADPSLSPIAVKAVKACLDLANRVGARLIVLHTGYPSSQECSSMANPRNTPFQELEPNLRGKLLQNLASSLKTCLDYARDLNLQLTVENGDLGSTHTCRKAEELEELLALVDSPDLGLTLDLAHAYLCANHLEFDLLDFLERLRAVTVHLHLSDNFGVYHPAFPNNDLTYGFGDLHLPIGLGSLPFKETLRALKNDYKGIYLMEIGSIYGFEGYRLSMENLKKILSES